MALVISDWDDTLFPRTAWTNVVDPESFTGTESSAISFLTTARDLARVYVVTNAERAWVVSYCPRFYGRIDPVLAPLTVVSARDRYGGRYPDDDQRWKCRTYGDLLRENPTVTQLIHVSDSLKDRQAVIDVVRRQRLRGRTLCLKSVKLVEFPTFQQLEAQLTVVSAWLPWIVAHSGDLDLQTRWTAGHLPVLESMPASAPAPASEPLPVSPREHLPIAIIGSGIAALSATLLLDVYKLTPVIFRPPQSGTHITATPLLSNYPGIERAMSGTEFYEIVERQVRATGTRFLDEEVISVDDTSPQLGITTTTGSYTADVILVATGLGHASSRDPRTTMGAESITKGLYGCLVCDRPRLQQDGYIHDGTLKVEGLHVWIVGNGDNAIETALLLSQTATQVNIVVRNTVSRASVILRDQLRGRENVSMFLNSRIHRIHGSGGVAVSVEIGAVAGVGTGTGAGADAGAGISTGVTHRADIIFLATGHVPNTKFLHNTDVDLDSDGYIVRPNPDSTETNVTNIFACGTVASHRHQTTVATLGDGARSATDINLSLALRTRISA